MTWATKRKLQYLTGFFILLFIVVGIPAFSIFYHKPTCMDGKQNQGEEGIDCGGPCPKLCRPQSLKPVVQWEQTFEVVPGVYTAVAYIQNPNVHAEAKNVGYTFTLYDSENKVVAERQGKMYIPPGKNFAVLETGIKLDKKPIRTFFDITGDYTWYVATDKPELQMKNMLVSNVDITPTIDVNVVNPTFTPVKQTEVSVIVYDADSNAMAASRTVVSALDKESSRHIIFTWPEPFPRPVSRVEFIPVITVLK